VGTFLSTIKSLEVVQVLGGKSFFFKKRGVSQMSRDDINGKEGGGRSMGKGGGSSLIVDDDCRGEEKEFLNRKREKGTISREEVERPNSLSPKEKRLGSQSREGGKKRRKIERSDRALLKKRRDGAFFFCREEKATVGREEGRPYPSKIEEERGGSVHHLQKRKEGRKKPRRGKKKVDLSEGKNFTEDCRTTSRKKEKGDPSQHLGKDIVGRGREKALMKGGEKNSTGIRSCFKV